MDENNEKLEINREGEGGYIYYLMFIFGNSKCEKESFLLRKWMFICEDIVGLE